jgi:hypothetical protein
VHLPFGALILRKDKTNLLPDLSIIFSTKPKAAKSSAPEPITTYSMLLGPYNQEGILHEGLRAPGCALAVVELWRSVGLAFCEARNTYPGTGGNLPRAIG